MIKMTTAFKILVIDDEPGIRDMLTYELQKQGFYVATAKNGEEGLEKLKAENFQLVISDLKMPKLGGLETLVAVKKINPDIEVILATGYADINSAVNAMKQGAYDFIQKPFDMGELLALIEKALEKRELKAVIGLYEVSKIMFQTIQLDKLLPIVGKLTRTVLRADDISILLLKGDRLEVALALGCDSDDRLNARLSLGERIAGKVAESKEPIIISGPLENDPRFAGLRSLRDIKTSIIYPLIVNGKLLGVLCANRTTLNDPFNNNDLRHMTIFGSQIAQAVYNAWTFKQLQETQNKLIHSERINAVGRFAAGIAHELNNPLTSILGFAQFLQREAKLPPTQKEDVECIIEQTQRCKMIAQGLLQFSRKTGPKKDTAGLSAVLDSVLKLIKLDIASKQILITKPKIEPEIMISADLCQMQQVFLNLIQNASHAMETQSERKLDIKVETKADRVQIHFKDNGCGIPPEHLNRLFEPFFSTKPVGTGTGLGLSICKDIITQHGGNIRVLSEPNRGTTFIIELPISLEQRPQDPKKASISA